MVRVVKKPEERRQEIVSASRKLFLSHGYENTKMEEVITKLKIAKGTIYHYFRSKEELLDAVVEEMVAEYMALVTKVLNECKGNALNKMEVLITAGSVAPRQKETLKKLHRFDNREMHVRLLAVTITRLAPLYATVISQGCKEGVFQVKHPLESAEILLAGIQFMTDNGCYPWSQKDVERRTRAIPYLLENQLNSKKGAFNFLSKFEV